VIFTDVLIGVKNEIFFRRDLDTPNQLEFARQIKIYVKSNSRPASSKHAAIAAPDCPSSGKSVSCGVLLSGHERPKP
jgi:hypothetical protein